MLLLSAALYMAPAEAAGQGPDPEQKAAARAERMKDRLQLSEKQYRKVCRLFLKTEKAVASARLSSVGDRDFDGMPPVRRGPSMAGQPPTGGMPSAGMHGGGPGGPRGERTYGPDRTKAPSDRPYPQGHEGVKDRLELPEMMTEQEINAREKEHEKLKKILSPGQYEKWQSGGRQDEQPEHRNK